VVFFSRTLFLLYTNHLLRLHAFWKPKCIPDQKNVALVIVTLIEGLSFIFIEIIVCLFIDWGQKNQMSLIIPKICSEILRLANCFSDLNLLIICY
jgi:hypothetical protein